ncbi:MAG TPA: TetR/AcrR family transcriptional regulator [Solirubrobacteraceae bacterium]|nr:TetR/AcrR family transcriptional regulator [Solirubrobacteraceae bacterium]
MGTLAELTTTRGLPRGRGKLPRDEVARAHRDRLLRAMTAAVAELGYANVRIADVVDRARVSRQSFYEQFPDKEACFLAAHERGTELILERLALSAHDIQGLDPGAQLRAGTRAYLGLAAAEPEFAHCMLIELPAIGPTGLAARLAAHEQIAWLLRDWHQSARAVQPRLPEVPPKRYAASVGAVHDLVYELVATGRTSEVPALEDDSYGAIAALLQIPAP